MSDVIKEGYLSVKEDGLRAWIWSKRYCVLRDQALTFHRNEVQFTTISSHYINLMFYFSNLDNVLRSSF
jgi:hypothetical protein